jgi:hypothetical protein
MDVTQHGELLTIGSLSGKWTAISESIPGQKLKGKIYWKPQIISAARPTLYNFCPLKWESRRYESRQIRSPCYNSIVLTLCLFLDSGDYVSLERVREMKEPRYTPHTYSGFWWVRDNETGRDVQDKAGRRFRVHINTWGMEAAAQKSKQKAEILNNAENPVNGQNL